MNATNPRVLLVYYSYTHQAEKIVDAMAEALVDRGCVVDKAAIEFTDPRYVEQFSKFPFNNGFLDVLKMLPAQLRRATGEIKIPDAAKSGDYDLVVVGSPTWWLTTSMPVRSFLKAGSTSTLLAGKKFTTFVVCRRYWGGNYKTVQEARDRARRTVRRRRALQVRGWSGSVAAVADQLPGLGRVPRALPRPQDPADEPAGRSSSMRRARSPARWRMV